ncbi:hypothetical protein BEP19_08740 [Ammoniphilus oxalaticus]|uniref:UvrD-like helicase C-terminal domain-containing protein n=1 Tax=Ammoniphilus oxalaticus TaxID=66863 RepID=A0A419SKA4_9BACL|nr:PD-(D/E)XK nuclease family protein [Ammoniphilus oxalaticus]RKD24464.1 hypothetical protein BEP19_08740 [Ammoniphilus oxalaticus]
MDEERMVSALRKLYTGPFGPMAREVWIENAKQRIEAGEGESFLFILPTSTLLKSVRDQLLEETGGISELHLMAFDDVADAVARYADPFTKMLTNYELRRFFGRFLEETTGADLWTPEPQDRDSRVADEVRQAIIRAISELKRSGMNAEQAEQIAHSSKYNPKHRALARLLIRSDQELSQLSMEKGYTWLTYEARLERASQLLNEGASTTPPWLRKIDTIWVDHFTDFFPLQFQLLRSLLQLPTVKQAGIYLPYQPQLYDEQPSQLFAQRSARRKGGLANLLDQTLQRLRDELDFVEVSFESENFDEIQQTIAADWEVDLGKLNERADKHPTISISPELWHLPTIAFTAAEPMQSSVHNAFTMMPCASERKEAEWVAKSIKQKLLNDPSLSPTDFAVIVRDKKQAAAWLHPVFTKEQLPLELRLERSLTELPLFQQVDAALRLQSSNWSRDVLLKIADGSYKRWSHPPGASFIRWAKERGVREGERTWHEALERDLILLEQKQREVAETTDEEVDRARALARLEQQRADLQRSIQWLTELKESLRFIQQSASMQEHLTGLEQFLDDWQIPQRLATFLKEKKGYQLDWFKRDVECLKIMRRSLAQLRRSVEQLGEQRRKLSFGQFLREWEEQWQDEVIFEDQGQAVSNRIACLEPTGSRGMSYSHVYVLGCNEGVFPMKHREQWLLDDTERLMLQENGALTASHYHHDMEKMFFVMAISAARTSLTFSFVSPKTNESMLPSSFLEAILKKLPDEWLEQAAGRWPEALSKKAYAEDTALISSPEEYGLWLMNKSKEESDGRDDLFEDNWLPVSFPSILQGTWMEQLRRFGSFSEWDGYIRNELAVQKIADLFAAEKTIFSISQINEYMSSPLTFFFRRVLGIYPLEEFGLDVSPLDKGMIQHEALRQFYMQHRGEVLALEQLASLQAELAEHVRDHARRFAQDTIYERSSIWELETERLATALGNWLEVELTGREKASPQLLPTYFELSFGMNPDWDEVDPASSPDEIAIELEQERLRLRGKIDRIDLDDQGNFAIYDYKSSLARYKNYLQLADGAVTFQLPIYLRAMQQFLQTKGIADPQMIGGAFYSIGENDGGKRQGIWDKERKALLGIDGRTRSYSIEEKIEEDLLQVEEGLRRLREGRFYLTSATRPNPYYADNALYRYDPIYLKHKEKGGYEVNERAH